MAKNQLTLGEEMKDLLDGLRTALPAGTQSFPVGSVVMTVSAVIQALMTFMGDWTVADDSGAKFHAAVQRRDDNAPAARAFVDELKPAILAVMGSKNPDLLKFGMKPRQARKKLTSEQRVQANAKSLATREARHTMGPRQKAKIKGEVPPAPPASPAK
jgi:hypothetical protein